MKRSKWQSVGMKAAVFSLVGMTLLPAAAGAMSTQELLRIAAGDVSVGASASAGTAVAVPATEVDASGQVKSDPPKISEKQAEDFVRKLFPEALKDATLQQITLGTPNSYPQRPNVWSMQWNVTVGNMSSGFYSTVDSQNGDLLDIYLGGTYEQTNSVYYPPKWTDEQVLEEAKRFIHQAAPSINVQELAVDSSKISSQNHALFGPVTYSISLDVPVNGLSGSGRSIYLTMDGNRKVTNFNYNKSDVNYPSATPKVTKAEAEKKLKSMLDLSLQYVNTNFWDRQGRGKWILAWLPDGGGTGLLMDAQTGDLMDYSGMTQTVGESKEYALQPAKSPFVPVKGSGSNHKLTADEAIAAVKKEFPIPDGTVANSSYYTDQDRQIWSLSWNEIKPNYPMDQYYSASVDAQTGQILSYFDNSNNHYIGSFNGMPTPDPSAAKPSAPAISADAAQVKADGLVSRIYPDAEAKLKGYISGVKNSTMEGFNFVYRQHLNGYPVSGSEVYVSLDPSGALTSYTANSMPGPDAEAAKLTAKLTKEEALAKYEAALQTKLRYLISGGYFTKEKFVEQTVNLVYERSMENPIFSSQLLDAASGQWVSAGMDPQPDGAAKTDAKDIAGHWAEDSLKTMLKYRILQPDGDGLVKPDDTLLIGDWMKMMMQAAVPDYSYYAARSAALTALDDEKTAPESPFNNAVTIFTQYRWIDAASAALLKPEEKLTREKLAESVIGILRYGKLSDQLDGKVTPNYEDAAQITNKADVYLAAELGIYASGGKFRPHDFVTKAEAATVLMNMVKLQGKLDQVISN